MYKTGATNKAKRYAMTPLQNLCKSIYMYCAVFVIDWILIMSEN